MGNLKAFFVRLAKDEQGKDLMEYAIFVAFLVMAAGAILTGFAESIYNFYMNILNGEAALTVTRDIESHVEAISEVRIVCAIAAIFCLGWFVLRRNQGIE